MGCGGGGAAVRSLHWHLAGLACAAMKATDWEFTNRALVFGLIFGCAFPLYAVDHTMSAAALANWLAPKLGMDADMVARLLLGLAALLLAAAALLRTWASAYLHAAVVYAADVKAESLVADGPYRRVRNPLYFANVLMAVGMGTLMSRVGFVVCVLAMVVFCYRLIFREEAELLAGQGEAYERYRKAVPQLWPALTPRIPSSGRRAKWADGFKAESWYWGFALAVAAFAVTLSVKVFFVIVAASVALFWGMSMVLSKKSDAASAPTSSPK
jgi:protein-S-isoprenylcysteine O-methyltransferase Ste14